MSFESTQTRSLTGSGYVARVRLPDDTEQDVALGYGRAGELVANLVDGVGSRAPEVRLDFTHGATPRVTWAEPDVVPLATSLQIVGKVCEALARAAGGVEPVRWQEPRDEVTVLAVHASKARPRALAALGFAATGVVALVALGAVRPVENAAAPRPAPIVAVPVVSSPPEPKPTAAAAPAAAAAIAAVQVEPERKPVAQPVRHAARHHRAFRLLRQQVEHGVRGLSPGTGLVALRTAPGLEVAVDGLWVGMTPVKPIALGEGSHVLELRRSGKRAETLELGVAAGDKATLYLRFE